MNLPSENRQFVKSVNRPDCRESPGTDGADGGKYSDMRRFRQAAQAQVFAGTALPVVGSVLGASNNSRQVLFRMPERITTVRIVGLVPNCISSIP